MGQQRGRQKRKTPALISEVLAGSDTGQGHKQKLQQYAGAKHHALAVAKYILSEEPALYKVAEQVEACGAWLIFRHFYIQDKYRLIGGCTCRKHLLCAMCALRRSAKQVMAYAAKIHQVVSDYPGLVPVLITLTIKNGADLEERTNHLESAFRRMVRNRSNAKAGGRHTTVFRLVHGAAGAFEFKRGANSGLWHPHVHLFALVASDVDLMAMEWGMSDEWRKLTRDSHNVDVTPIDWGTEESQLRAVCEVFRYALKFGEMEIADQVHAYKVLSGRRLVRDFGSLHGVVVSDDPHQAIEEELKLQPYVDMMYEYSVKQGYLLRSVCDTEDLYTGGKPKATEGTKAANKLSSRLCLPVIDRLEEERILNEPGQPDRRKLGRKRGLDQNYMDQWAARQNLEPYQPEEVPF